jgi:phage terminase large subunit-like protein
LNASSAAGTLKQDLSDFTEAELAATLAEWPLWARDDQLPPDATGCGEVWRVWLVMGGRGAGKTRAGAEWVGAKALGLTPLGEVAACRIALVGETMAEIRRVVRSSMPPGATRSRSGGGRSGPGTCCSLRCGSGAAHRWW